MKGTPNISTFLEDNDGGFSSTRLVMILWMLGVLIVWIYKSLTQTELQPIPESVVAVIGIIVTGKAVQRYGEKANVPPGATADDFDNAKNALAVVPPQ